jgi:hypothetical protein
MAHFKVFGKTIHVWILLACMVGMGSLVITLHSTNDELINLDPSSTMIETSIPVVDENTDMQNSGVNTTADLPVATQQIASFEPTVVTGVPDVSVTTKEKPVTKFAVDISGRTRVPFGIDNNSEEPVVFLIKAKAMPQTPVNLATVSGSTKIYSSANDGWWFAEVRPSTNGKFVIDVLGTDTHAIEVEVERAFSIDPADFVKPPVVTDVISVTTTINKAITSFAVGASGRVHFTWGIDNNSAVQQIFLIKLKTTPELLINLELIGHSTTRIYQRTNEGYFLTVVEPSLSGDKFFSAVSGPAFFTIEGEVERII